MSYNPSCVPETNDVRFVVVSGQSAFSDIAVGNGRFKQARFHLQDEAALGAQ